MDFGLNSFGASVVEFTSTAMAYHVDRAGTHPLKQDNTPIALLMHQVTYWAKPRFSRLVVRSWVREKLSRNLSSEENLSLASNFQASRYSGVMTTARLNMPGELYAST